ncbi:hypothetical protein O1611_g2481 [Lasiodiplodia mahajangana]|uniref:Uncharacterized protein n=1 Tax=Lasiodiplodia mahajangana TaxID=1108764 RepID=A0ACC2JUS2_9PEZI|nr:hypothetical protein O1611_g2481 [Lasiodiplodia mahajangana]
MSHPVRIDEEHLRPPISDAEWDGHKDIITSLYKEQGMKLDDLMSTMEAHYNFKDSIAQYHSRLRRWKIAKNHKRIRADPAPEVQNLSFVPQSTQDFNSSSEFLGVISDIGLIPFQYAESSNSYSEIGQGQFANPIEATNEQLSNVYDLDGSTQDTHPSNQEPEHSTTHCHPIHYAVLAGNLDSVKVLVGYANRCASAIGPDNTTPVWIAAKYGYLDIINFLLSLGVDVEIACTATGRTPIHQAAEEGHFEVVKALLDYGALPDQRDSNGVSPLWSAAREGHHEILKLLLDKQASTETAFKDAARRPIHRAVDDEHTEMLRLLIEAGAEANPQRFKEELASSLRLAARNRNFAIGELLIRHLENLEFSLKPSHCQTTHQVAKGGHTDPIRLLFKENRSIDARDYDGWTPLMVAAQEGHHKIVTELLGHGSDVNAKSKNCVTALWVASRGGYIDIVKELHKHGARVLPTEGSKRLPIHEAAQSGHLDVVKYLVDECAADVNAEDGEKATPLILASQGKDKKSAQILGFLCEKGAKAAI